MQIRDSIALVTGANRGLGRALVAALLDGGAAKVYAGARDVSALDEPVATGRGRVVPVKLDITRADQVTDAAATCADASLVINNAGINRQRGLLAASSIDDARAEFETNYLGTLAMCRAFAPQLRRHRGALVNVLSILAKACLPAMGSLCASKAAGLRLTEGVRAELAADGVLVVAVMTGAVDTDMSRDFDGPKSAPAEVASAILAAVERGDEEVHVGEMAAWINEGLRSGPKDLEKALARYLPR